MKNNASKVISVRLSEQELEKYLEIKKRIENNSFPITDKQAFLFLLNQYNNDTIKKGIFLDTYL